MRSLVRGRISESSVRSSATRLTRQVTLGLALVLIVALNAYPSAAAASKFAVRPAPHERMGLHLRDFRRTRLVASTDRSQAAPISASQRSKRVPLPPFRPRDRAQYLAAKGASIEAHPPRTGLIVHGGRSAVGEPATPHVAQLTAIPTAFPGMSYTRQVNALGRAHAIWPPDTQLGAGPTQLVEMVNDTASVWSKTGTLLGSVSDLNAFYDVPYGYSFSDPRVLYDPISSRWFASGLAFDAYNDSAVFVGVSDTSDALGSWTTWNVGTFAGIIADQPKLGVADDKVVISWNDYDQFAFMGEETWVIQESDMLIQAPTPSVVSFGPDSSRFGLVPAVAETSTPTSWLVYSNSSYTDSPVVGVVAIDGTPATNDVTWTETDPSTSPTAFPPRARQAWGRPIDTGDDRLLSAAYRSGEIWASGNDGCIPNGDTRARACLRFVQGQTGSPPSLLQDFDVAINGNSLDYPAVAIEGGGKVDFVFSRFASSRYPSVWTGQISGSSATIAPMRRGQGPYSGWDPNFAANRWGDYSGAAVDPSDSSVVWLAGEFAATSVSLHDWGTEIGRLWSMAPADGTPPRLSKVRDAPDPFSPNGDGIRDKVRIYWTVSEGAAVTDWIRRKGGRVVATFRGYVVKGSWFDVWNGRSDGGRRVRAGTYVYRIVAVDGYGNRSATAKGTITDLG
jgi:hypothetical protein